MVFIKAVAETSLLPRHTRHDGTCLSIHVRAKSDRFTHFKCTPTKLMLFLSERDVQTCMYVNARACAEGGGCLSLWMNNSRHAIVSAEASLPSNRGWNIYVNLLGERLIRHQTEGEDNLESSLLPNCPKIPISKECVYVYVYNWHTIKYNQSTVKERWCRISLLCWKKYIYNFFFFKGIKWKPVESNCRFLFPPPKNTWSMN